ncbi:SirB2 family protein [Pleionea sp. CnH1-48]|uniref:SirB2 family protein n=1 Tax=Pleionea sp. CnH1-48 TaxID=2954494 RepID=UPI0020969564|nr:SirB2 family protein [Pleionea sp. CnH1-48]MCO7227057.1 SirB2 family protein [Pleionea sp. CnH1-48]
MVSYVLVKHIHMSCAVLTLLFFLIRGYWMLTGSKMLSKKPVKILPHVIDTVLLISAITLVVMSGWYPTWFNWVTLKIILLVGYIVVGTIALKRGRTKKVRAVAFVVAVALVFGLFAVAGMKPSF